MLRTDEPDAKILSEIKDGQNRLIRLLITSPPESYVTVVQFRMAAGIRILEINDRELTDAEMSEEFRNQPLINYFAPDEDGFEVLFSVPEAEVPEIYLRSNIPGLPPLENDSVPDRRNT